MNANDEEELTPQEREKLRKLRAKYWAIEAWDRMLGSSPYYTDNQVTQADLDGAPEDAIYRKHDPKPDEPKWAKVRDLSPDHKFRQWYEEEREKRK